MIGVDLHGPYKTCCLLYLSGEILKLVARSLFKLMINEYMTANVCLYLCFQLRMMYMKYTLSN